MTMHKVSLYMHVITNSYIVDVIMIDNGRVIHLHQCNSILTTFLQSYDIITIEMGFSQ